jgi:hypothetical protein
LRFDDRDITAKTQEQSLIHPNQNQIDAHFGHCEHFMVFIIDDQKKIITEEKISSFSIGVQAGMKRVLILLQQLVLL